MKSFPMDQITDKSALCVRGLSKRYDNHQVIRDLNMTVPEGCIYGLLGPSGCGKTTLLNCIMGNIHYDTGSIYMSCKKQSQLGFMPQDVALIESLSIFEMFSYYGRMFGMSTNKIEARAEELKALLQLPPLESRNGCLSGGEQRRVSFAVALLHDPEFLILDEPTVGLDPLLSQSIWLYLVKLTTKTKKTIILTTHYIEEARHAHMVGLMRGGSILAEAPPMNLMSSHNCSTLEQTFLIFSQADEQSHKLPDETVNQEPSLKLRSPIAKQTSFSFSRFKAQLLKNTLYVTREVPLLLILFLMPIMQCTFQNVAVGHDPTQLPIAVVNHDHYDCAPHHHSHHTCDWDTPISCRFLSHLQRTTDTLHIVDKHNLLEAERDLKRNNVWGLLYFAPNFTQAIAARYVNASVLNTPDDVFDIGAVNIRLDMSNHVVANIMRMDLSSTLIDFLKELFHECNWPDTVVQLPMRIEEPIYGSRRPIFTHFQSPAILVAFDFYLPLLFTTGFLLHEKVSGVLERTMTVGFFMTAVSNSHVMAMMGGTGIFFFVTFTSGVLWPLEGIHSSMREVIWWSPLALSTEAMRGITARNWPITHPHIYKAFMAITGWTAVFLIATYVVIKYRGFHYKK
ncbi:ABC transporter G family member 23 isoform X2 [Nilaparvata lugens]|uniref:ABC transporter G family member 23 isoform X2 n=1 Tax=Nilaparvata lugens TaxID=108931 RepID=UPI00193CE5EF|nr:ABC transporter G family member 23 isoform X2 [Nilaparvata lugens]